MWILRQKLDHYHLRFSKQTFRSCFSWTISDANCVRSDPVSPPACHLWVDWLGGWGGQCCQGETAVQIIMKWIGKASRKIKLTFRCFLGLEHQLGAPGSFVSSTDDHDDYLDCCLFMLLCIFMILMMIIEENNVDDIPARVWLAWDIPQTEGKVQLWPETSAASSWYGAHYEQRIITMYGPLKVGWWNNDENMAVQCLGLGSIGLYIPSRFPSALGTSRGPRDISQA